MKLLKAGQKVSLIADNCSITNNLNPGIYMLGYDDMQGSFFLDKQSFDSFKVPSTLYGNADEITTRIINTYYRKDQRMGVLLHGEKGTGKSIISKKVINAIAEKVPVIMIKNYFVDSTKLEAFLNELNTPVAVFIDEFEKIYKDDRQNSILSIMDGTGQSDILFLLTSNGSNLSAYLRNRPGRLFYSIKFEGLDADTINAVIEAKLKKTDKADMVRKVCTIIGRVNFDLLVSVIDEINNSETVDINELFYYLNIEPANEVFTVTAISKIHKDAVIKDYNVHRNPLVVGYRIEDYWENALSKTGEMIRDKDGEGIYYNEYITPQDMKNLTIEDDIISFETDEVKCSFERTPIKSLVF